MSEDQLTTKEKPAGQLDETAGHKDESLQEAFDRLKKEGLINDDNGAPKGEIEKAVAKTEETDGGDADRPEWLPEKFKSVEEMAKAYSELEKKQSGGDAKEAATEPKKDEAAADAANASAEEAAAAAKAAGVNFEELSASYAENGQLSDAEYKKLADGGIPKAMVDAYIAGVEAQNAQYEAKVFEAAGGEEAYDKLTDWGAQNLTDAEIEAFDSAVNSGNMGQVAAAVNGLKARMQLNQGKAPEATVNGKNAGGPVQGFRSTAEMEAAMNNPLYDTDPAYREDVYRKMAAAKF